MRKTVIGKLALAGYGCAVVICALFGLSALHLANVELINWADSGGNLYTGSASAVNGDFEGDLTIEFASGERYSGLLAASGFDGQSTYASQDGWSITGNFTNGYLDGFGIYSDARGAYEGQFKQSVPQGWGIYKATLGWVYTGEFVQGLITGYGELRLKDGTVHVGTWQNGKLVTPQELPLTG